MNKYLRLTLFGLAGTIAGYAYYYFIGCQGSCPISSNPFISAGYGLAVGIVLGWPSKKGVESAVGTDDT